MKSADRRNLLARGAIWFSFSAILLSLGSLSAHSWYYLPYLSDDSLISLRYASRLLHGHGLTWTNGPPVEGYSNLLWTLLAALLGSFGVDLIHAVRILGLIGMSSVVVLAVVWYMRRYELREIWLPLAVGLFFFCGATPIAIWMIGGLEQPLLAALLGAAIALAIVVMEADLPRSKTTLALSLVLGLLCITRLDGPIFTVAALVSIALGRRSAGAAVSPARSHPARVVPLPFLCGSDHFSLLVLR